MAGVPGRGTMMTYIRSILIWLHIRAIHSLMKAEYGDSYSGTDEEFTYKAVVRDLTATHGNPHS